MTRKRFVKLLMAAGYDRNEANDAAEKARRCGMEYSTACNVYRKISAVDITAFGDALRNIVDMAAKVVVAFTKAAEAFAKTYRAEMEAN